MSDFIYWLTSKSAFSWRLKPTKRVAGNVTKCLSLRLIPLFVSKVCHSELRDFDFVSFWCQFWIWWFRQIEVQMGQLEYQWFTPKCLKMALFCALLCHLLILCVLLVHLSCHWSFRDLRLIGVHKFLYNLVSFVNLG